MKKRINWKPYIIAAIIGTIIGVGFFCLFFFGLKRPVIDGTGYASVVLIGIAVLIWIGREGFFDIFAYGFKQLGSQFFSKKPNEYNKYADYKEFVANEREKKSKYYLSFIAIGIIFLIITIAFSIYTNH